MCLFLNISVLQGGVVSTSPNPEAGGPPLVGCTRLLIKFIRSYPPYRRPFLYPQPEDAPCRGDRDPLHGYYRLQFTKYELRHTARRIYRSHCSSINRRLRCLYSASSKTQVFNFVLSFHQPNNRLQNLYHFYLPLLNLI